MDVEKERVLRRPFAIVVQSRLPRQLPLRLSAGLSQGHRRPPAKRPRRRPPPPPASLPHRGLGAASSTRDDLLAAVRKAIEAQGEELLVLPDVPTPRARMRELWLSPTKAGLRYGEVCIAKTPAGALLLVRVNSYRAANRQADKRPYRRWHGLDLVHFLQSGVKREVRIAQVLKGSRC